ICLALLMSNERPPSGCSIAQVPAGSGSLPAGLVGPACLTGLPTSRMPQLVSAAATAAEFDTSKITAIPARMMTAPLMLRSRYNPKLTHLGSLLRRNALPQRSFEARPNRERKHVEAD